MRFHLTILTYGIFSSCLAFGGYGEPPYPEMAPKGLCVIRTEQGRGSGIIIGRYVLTAAHVVNAKIKTITTQDKTPLAFFKKNVIIHPTYNPNNTKPYPSDLALIPLKKHYPTDVRMPPNSELTDLNIYSNGYASNTYWFGFGHDSIEPMDILQAASLNNRNILTSGLIGEPFDHPEISTDQYYVTKDKRSFLTNGDSGGPLLHKLADGFILIGWNVAGNVNKAESNFEKIEPHFTWLTDKLSNPKLTLLQKLVKIIRGCF